ncbi:MAG: metal ABC transporter permease [Desulfuromonadaceae bacterium]|nr:metal ABC transporter permease [Desulfuromonadaceae bacterium]
MTAFFHALASQDFLQIAFIGGLLASIACGVMGSYVVVKRMSFLAGGIAHAVLGGMGVAYFFGKSPISGAIAAALVAAWVIGWVSLRWRQTADTIIAALWSVGMAVGVIFISMTPGYNVDLMSYLFGNILMIPRSDLYIMATLDGLIMLAVLVFYQQFMAVCFDEEFARLRGLPVVFFYLLLLTLVALTVVVLIQVVGLILVIALLTLPAAIAAQYLRRLAPIMVLATILGMLFTGGGLALSYTPDLPAGATIILVAGTAYLVSLLVTGFARRRRC